MTWRRFGLLAVVLLIYTIVMAEIGTVLCSLVMGARWSESLSGDRLGFPFANPAGWLTVLVPAFVMTATQMMFLLPAVRPAVLEKHRGKSLARSLIAAGFAGSMLAAALGFGFVELCTSWSGASESIVERYSSTRWCEYWLWWPFVLASWVLWTPLVLVFARRRMGRRWFERVIAALFAGTVLELLIVVPVDIMVRRRTSCYCGTGTCFALCLSVCAALWMTGPGIVLAATSKRRRWWGQTHCMNCGYEKGPSPGERCPECGVAWREAASG